MMSLSNHEIVDRKFRRIADSRFPIVSITVLVYAATLGEQTPIVIALIAVLLFYTLLLGIKTFDALILIVFTIIFFILSGRFSLSLIFPMIAITVAMKQLSIATLDYISATFLAGSIVLLKVFFDLDDIIYLDRNHIGLMILLLALMEPTGNNKLIGLIKISSVILALALLSRTYILFVCLFVLMLTFKERKFFNTKVGELYPIVFLIATTLFSLYLVTAIDLDIFVSTVGNESARIIEITDASNLARINAFLSFLDNVIRSPISLLYPATIENYQDINGEIPTPHNTLLAIIFNYGTILSILYLLYVGNIFKRLRLKSLFFLAFTPYYLLLGGVLFGPALILFCIAGRGLSGMSNQIRHPSGDCHEDVLTR